MTLQLIAVMAASIGFTSCGNSNTTTSSVTGWKINDKKGGFQYNTAYDGTEVPYGMVAIEGGTFTMGRVQEDVMGDWNNTATQQYVQSFFMDETEVTNLMYNEYLSWTKAVYPPTEARYRQIYAAALPDTLVWATQLGFTETLTNTYLRHPAYANYPVVGVSWIQANDFSKWRTDRVNELNLERAGYLARGAKTSQAYGEQSFSTETYLMAPTSAFAGNDSIVYRGVRNRADANQSGVYAKMEYGVFTAEFRLPTEAEWEYAASVRKSDRIYNNSQGRNRYPWGSSQVRTNSRRTQGDYLANFKQGRGDYGGIAGWTTDGGEITSAVKTFPPNDWGLYDMAGNVAEWVADVYRPEVSSHINDLNYFRGNVYNKRAIGADGTVQIVGSNIEYDTLPNGRLHPRALPGQVQVEQVGTEDTFLRRNFQDPNSISYKDGDNFESADIKGSMYNAPVNSASYDQEGNLVLELDDTSRTSLINNNSRVIKGGSWKDRAYWLDPATRRFVDQYTATDFIGFRNAMTKIGNTKSNAKKKARG